jgi:hypothetical protein
MAAIVPQTGIACGATARKVVERAALVAFEMRKCRVAQSGDREQLLDGLADDRKQAAHAGVEEHRRVVDDDVLVEAETAAVGEVDGAC